jgi:hypothetical protein
MKFFWKFLAQLYCDLVSFGWKRPPPAFLFNHPKKPLEYKYFAVLLADVNFTPLERQYVLAGVKDLENFCNGMMRFEVRFELETDSMVAEDSSLILKVKSDNPIIVAADGYYKTTVIGLCQSISCGTRLMYLVYDRLKDHNTYRTTMTHELGHYIGLDHTKHASIMHKSNFGNVLYMTRIDAEEFAKIYDCDPEELRYFKL